MTNYLQSFNISTTSNSCSSLPIQNIHYQNHIPFIGNYSSLPHIPIYQPYQTFYNSYSSYPTPSYANYPTCNPTYYTYNPNYSTYNTNYSAFNPNYSSGLEFSGRNSYYSNSIINSGQIYIQPVPDIQFTDSFNMPIKKHNIYENLNLEKIAQLVPNGFTGGILEPEIDPRNNKLKICNSVSLKEIPSKIWIRNGDNLVEVPNHLLEKNPQISDQNSDSLPMITPQTIISETSFSHKNIVHDRRFDHLPLPEIMKAFQKLNESLNKTIKITNHEEEILKDAKLTHENCNENSLTTYVINSLPSISGSTPLSSPSSLSPTPPSTTINLKLEIMTLKGKMVNGDLEKYELGSKFIFRFVEEPRLGYEAILC